MSGNRKDTDIGDDFETDKSVGRFLHASAVQIEAATDETQQEIEGLSQLVLALVQHASGMSQRLDTLAQSNIEAGEMAAIREEISSLDAAANKTIARLQFADRLHQRLSNVKGNLDALADLIGGTTLSEKRWNRFLEKSRAAFTMEHERRLFDEYVYDDQAETEIPANDPFGDNIALFSPRSGESDGG